MTAEGLKPRPEIEGPKQEGTSRVIDELISELRTNLRVTHPTKYEQILEMFRSTGEEGVSFDNVLTLYSGTNEPKQAAWIALYKLNRKLESKGLQIRRPARYFLREIDND